MTTLRTLIVLGTMHLDKDTSATLSEMGEDVDHARYFGDWRDHVVRCGYGYGHWIKLPVPDEGDPEDTLEARLAILPRSLADCMRHASHLGAAWILFDRDEPETDRLERYDW